MCKRLLIQPISDALKDTPVIVVNGARQVGKSTLCRQLIDDGLFNGKLVTMDEPTVLAAAAQIS